MDGGRDRRRGVAARADPRALDPRGRRAAVRGGRARDARRPRSTDLAERVEVLPDRLLLYTDDGEEALARVHERGLDAGRGAGAPRPRWRTSSSASPAGRWSTDGASHAPAGAPTRARTRWCCAAVRLLATRLPAHLEGLGDHLVREPLLYVAAMGVLLGGYVDDGGADLERRVVVPRFVAPGLLAATAMQIAAGEVTWPVMGAIKWDRTYYAMIATPLRVADIVAGHLLLRRRSGSRPAPRCSCVVLALVRRLRPSLGAVAASWPVRCSRAGVRRSCLRLLGALEDRAGLRADLPAAVMPMFLFSGAFFPIAQPARRRWRRSRRLTPLWHGVDAVPDAARSDTSRPARRWCTWPTCSLLAARRLVVAVRRLEQAAGGLSGARRPRVAGPARRPSPARTGGWATRPAQLHSSTGAAGWSS